ncbi:MAG: hypothetical protein HZA54_10110 [Planctomycetes bacterium]|nr:hypothetical protein [Planctomycetota bacterium]
MDASRRSPSGSGRIWAGILLAFVLGPASRALAESPPPLLVEEFAAAGAWEVPPGWTRGVGAQSGNGPAAASGSAAGRAGEGSCLQLSGVAETGTWWLVESAACPVAADRDVRLSAWMATDEVRAEGRQFANCNLLLTFRDREGRRVPVSGLPFLTTPPLFGTQAWTAVARRVTVPPGAVEARVACFLSCSGVARFDDVRLEEVPRLEWRTLEEGRYRYRHLPGDEIAAETRRANAAFLEELETRTGLAALPQVEYWKYPTLALKAELTGVPGNAHVDRAAPRIHSIWGGDRHEVVHLLLRPQGDPPAVLGEGIAVYFSGGWQGKGLATALRERAAGGRSVAIGTILSTRDFRAHDDDLTYPTAGHFVERLVAQVGLPRVLELFRATSGLEDPAAFREAFGRVIGCSPEEVPGR